MNEAYTTEGLSANVLSMEQNLDAQNQSIDAQIASLEEANRLEREKKDTDNDAIEERNKEIENLIEKVKNGSTVAFVDVNVFKGKDNENLLALREIIPDLTVFDGRDWLYHKELVIANKDVFDGLSKKIVDLDVFIECFPHVVFKTNQTPTDVICPGFQTGYHCESSAYGLYHAIEGFKVGKGMIYLFTFPLNRNYCFDRLFMNFVQYLSKRN
jgi:hypothetical protein